MRSQADSKVSSFIRGGNSKNFTSNHNPSTNYVQVFKADFAVDDRALGMFGMCDRSECKTTDTVLGLGLGLTKS